MLTKLKTNQEKKWVVRADLSEGGKCEVSDISEGLGISPVLATLLQNRGYRDVPSARAFLQMETELLCNPFELKDIEKAVARIRRAVEDGEPIIIYGDYDVDGVTAVSTLYLYLQSRGAKVRYYIPNRTGEGYGVSCSALDYLSEEGPGLLVTVDTGVTAVEEVAYAKTLGMDVVITDHHECRSDLPQAVAVVNPHRPDCSYPFKELAGVGVVFKLICAYEETVSQMSRLECASKLCREYADFVAIGTIADVMPIYGENRLIVAYGLRLMEENLRPGIAELMKLAGGRGDTADGKSRRKKQQITSGYIGYTLAPRINAAGRIRSASLAVELFLSENAERAEKLAKILCDANDERKNEENHIMEEAYAQIEANHDFENDPVIVLEADHWHHGVIGIVASRITEKYGLPSILVSFEGCESDTARYENIGKGSGRSVKGMNLVDALVHCKDCLVKYGGHELAAGLSVKRGMLDEFRRKINEYAREMLTEESLSPVVEADCELNTSQMDMQLAEELRYLEPFGVANPVPLFVLRNVTVKESIPISGGKHTKLILGDEKVSFTAMCFSRTQSQIDLYVGDKADVLFNLDINEWNGKKSVQMIVKDIKTAERSEELLSLEMQRFEEIRQGGAIAADEDVVPNRDDFAAVYQFVRQSVRFGCDCLSRRAIQGGIYAAKRQIGYIKLKFIILIFQELNIIGIEELPNECYRFKLRVSTAKTDLEKSNLLHKLRLQQKQS